MRHSKAATNPILQDPGLAFHPPFLYLGYVGFSIAFSFAIAALLEGRIDAAWARWVRPWVLGAWMCLTLGIAVWLLLGLLRARLGRFLVLGSRRKRFADAMARRHRTTSFRRGDGKARRPESLDHTSRHHRFLVVFDRDVSGSLWRAHLRARVRHRSSARHFHSGDPRPLHRRRFGAVCMAGAIAEAGGLFAPISREGALVLNNLLLTSACATVFVGTLYPLALEAITGEKISVGPPFFNSTFAPLFIPLLVAMPFGPLLGWKRGDLLAAGQRLAVAAILAAIAVAAAFALQRGGPVLAPFGLGIAIFVMAGAVVEIVERTLFLRIPFGAAFRRAVGLPRARRGAPRLLILGLA